MIDVQDLQIGNYFKDNEGNVLTVRGMTPEDDTKNSVIWYGNELGFYLTADECEPIPIDESILLRCGFVLFSKTEFKISYNMPKHPFIEVIYNQTYHWHVRLYCSYRVDISSLHQLQNLVKILTNETIELKDA